MTCTRHCLHCLRNALSNSLYCPRHNIGSITNTDVRQESVVCIEHGWCDPLLQPLFLPLSLPLFQLRSYMDDWFLGKRMTLVGLGKHEVIENGVLESV